MATHATAQATLAALRRDIARIEGTLPERLAQGSRADGVVLRRDGRAVDRVPTGAEGLDAALGGGVPCCGLTELHAAGMREAGALAFFALSLAWLVRRAAGLGGPLLWIGGGDVWREGGVPYVPGLTALCGVAAADVMFACPPRPEDALWIAEEALRVRAIAGVLVELRGDPRVLDLTATRRLHRRGEEGGRPVLLLRPSATAAPTAAPVRLEVASAPAGLRASLAGPVTGSIGPPALAVTIGKSRTALNGRFVVEWNPHDRTFRERTALPGALAAASQRRQGAAPAARPVVALAAAPAAPAAGLQPPGGQRPAHRRA